MSICPTDLLPAMASHKDPIRLATSPPLNEVGSSICIIIVSALKMLVFIINNTHSITIRWLKGLSSLTWR